MMARDGSGIAIFDGEFVFFATFSLSENLPLTFLWLRGSFPSQTRAMDNCPPHVNYLLLTPKYTYYSMILFLRKQVFFTILYNCLDTG
ncbi:MAG: hypothetical protein RLZZ338_542 [Cyanobacteriota bacterium]